MGIRNCGASAWIWTSAFASLSALINADVNVDVDIPTTDFHKKEIGCDWRVARADSKEIAKNYYSSVCLSAKWDGERLRARVGSGAHCGRCGSGHGSRDAIAITNLNVTAMRLSMQRLYRAWDMIADAPVNGFSAMQPRAAMASTLR
ncbi:hypothetical protein EVAR_82400_1 [Eumeta japonica]|uniref:Uncharacterized protein n=1 Tax=Eumeta variegata TaxID=151549 RepID=A0A4C1U9Z7_EUMVA|nr:hypothetical protein EVAR_82400_1 [Eumeta japonica]